MNTTIYNNNICDYSIDKIIDVTNITIDKNNIHDYLVGNFLNVINIKWSAGELKKSVIDNFPNLEILDCSENYLNTLEPISNCTKLKKLDCGYNNLRTLEYLSNCTNLEILDCSFNKLCTLEPLSNCTNLQILDCSFNKLQILESLSNCTKLKILNCMCNNLRTLKHLSNCTKLNKLCCSRNTITTLEPLSNCTKLNKLYCSDNYIFTLGPLSDCLNLRVLCCDYNNITELEPLSNCINLRKLYCNYNRIITLEPLSKCTNISSLYCRCNIITTLEPLIHLSSLTCIHHYGNPLGEMTTETKQFLYIVKRKKEIYDSVRDIMYNNKYTTIYDNKENIENKIVKDSINDSIIAIFSDPKPIFSIDDIMESELSFKTKKILENFCLNKIFRTINMIRITYQDLLSYVWNRIIRSEHRLELMKILDEEISNADRVCFSGQIARTVSVLVGFYDDINIRISDNCRISAIILNCKNKINSYDSQIHINMSIELLNSAGYSETEIKPWIDALVENRSSE